MIGANEALYKTLLKLADGNGNLVYDAIKHAQTDAYGTTTLEWIMESMARISVANQQDNL